jgi:hypothetical protein
MREHDALPRAMRLVGISTTAKWTACSIRAAWAEAAARWPNMPHRIMRRALDVLDEASGEDTFKHYGPNHPECPEQFKARRAPKGAWWAQQGRVTK